jgi:hypothetical protein
MSAGHNQAYSQLAAIAQSLAAAPEVQGAYNCPQCGTPCNAPKQSGPNSQNPNRWYITCPNKKATDPSKSCHFKWLDEIGKGPATAAPNRMGQVVSAYQQHRASAAVMPPTTSVQSLETMLAEVQEEIRGLKRAFDRVYPSNDL